MVQPQGDHAAGVVATEQFLQVHRLVLQRSPQPFDEPVVDPAAPAVHADAHTRFHQRPEHKPRS